jgi:hypothetical protein
LGGHWESENACGLGLKVQASARLGDMRVDATWCTSNLLLVLRSLHVRKLSRIIWPQITFNNNQDYLG